MARVYTEPINKELPAYFTGGTAEVSRPHEVVQVVSHFICHDLRAFVRHILGFVQLLHENYAHLDNTNRRHLDNPRVREYNFDPVGRSSKPCPGCTVRDSQKELDLNRLLRALNQLHPQIAGRPVIWQAERCRQCSVISPSSC